MKVILNKDLATLGEEGDIKEVAKGYARNYLFPRNIALPYTQRNINLFESRKAEIDARKEQKRKDAAGIQERLEALDISITMPAGANGKLYGAVTSQTIVDELFKHGFQVERKRVEIPNNSIKNTGKYKLIVKLYGNTQAEIAVTVIAQIEKAEEKPDTSAKVRRHHSGRSATEEVKTEETVAPEAVTPEAEPVTEAPTA
ncbi:MAG: 50S ribosomal protein L9 [Termitinemataceae bacterium]|nr:MAG: 50S ribosomal protein L9 [Termitinemataceae bacterium]